MHQYIPFLLAFVAAACQVTCAGHAIWATRRAARFERALRLMQTGPRAEAKTVVAPLYHAPDRRTPR